MCSAARSYLSLLTKKGGCQVRHAGSSLQRGPAVFAHLASVPPCEEREIRLGSTCSSPQKNLETELTGARGAPVRPIGVPAPALPLWRRGIVICFLRSLTFPLPLLRAPVFGLSGVRWLAWGVRRGTGGTGACLALGRGEQASTRRDRRERVRAQRVLCSIRAFHPEIGFEKPAASRGGAFQEDPRLLVRN